MDNEQKILKQAFAIFDKKKKTYGDNVDAAIISMLLVLFPEGVPTHRFDDVMFLVRICEKLGRIASDNIDVEAKKDAFGDIVGYGLLGLYKDGQEKKEALKNEDSKEG